MAAEMRRRKPTASKWMHAVGREGIQTPPPREEHIIFEDLENLDKQEMIKYIEILEKERARERSIAEIVDEKALSMLHKSFDKIYELLDACINFLEPEQQQVIIEYIQTIALGLANNVELPGDNQLLLRRAREGAIREHNNMLILLFLRTFVFGLRTVKGVLKKIHQLVSNFRSARIIAILSLLSNIFTIIWGCEYMGSVLYKLYNPIVAVCCPNVCPIMGGVRHKSKQRSKKRRRRVTTTRCKRKRVKTSRRTRKKS
tara:strand:+ start:208 stop:981 length:774 start_codon:yes stop_codon:yes gene_type:complete